MLTVEQILGANDSAIEHLDVPEWGGVVCLRVMSGRQRDDVVETAARELKAGKEGQAKAKLLRYCLCDEAAKPLFSAAQVDALLEKSGLVVDRVARAAMRLNALLPDSVDDLSGN